MTVAEAIRRPAHLRATPHEATRAVPGTPALIGLRIALWLGVQLAIAGVIALVGTGTPEGPVNAAARWWTVYAALVDLGTLGVLLWLLRREGRRYRPLLGAATPLWQVALGTLAVLAATAPAVIFSAELTARAYGDAIPPMLAIVDVPPLADAFSVAVVPLLAELAEPVVFLAMLLPWLERRLGRTWLAATIVVAVWGAEHAFYPILLAGGGVDLAYSAYRVASVLPFLAIWTALYLVFGRRLLPIMAARWIFNGGTWLALALGAMG